jgi:tRNA(Arg) A34 adenosine deaminase TadA
MCKCSSAFGSPAMKVARSFIHGPLGLARSLSAQSGGASMLESALAALPFAGQVPLRPEDERHLLTAIELARRSREKGNHPFGSLLVDADGEALLEAENTAVAGGDRVGHAELNLVRAACEQFAPEFLHGCTLYTSTEPCAMCAGAIYWSGVGRVVYALSSETLQAIVNDHEGDSTLALPCRELFARGGRRVEVEGRCWKTKPVRCTKASGSRTVDRTSDSKGSNGRLRGCPPIQPTPPGGPRQRSTGPKRLRLDSLRSIRPASDPA